MKICILDLCIQCPGLKTVFPEADYYVTSLFGKYDLDKTPEKFKSVFNFDYREDIENITDTNYDMLFILYGVLNLVTMHEEYQKYHKMMIDNVLRNNKFKRVVFFTNDDYDADPSIYFDEWNVNVWFKRNYNKNKQYNINVFPFPFIQFGRVCPLWFVLNTKLEPVEKENRILWGDV